MWLILEDGSRHGKVLFECKCMFIIDIDQNLSYWLLNSILNERMFNMWDEVSISVKGIPMKDWNSFENNDKNITDK